ncbi:LysR family transcriptional regulator [Rouxiella sp. WC2420]|uniref:LysR family transcriptional regulator n=1 Tax=Rouxiella sp. WC2420 TaxID=3234145 RepID=A0AB39VWT2_9GAMM
MSFIDAATSLGLTASAVGKVITRLEEHYGVKLFNRNTRSMSLTEEGEIFLKHSVNILCEMESLKEVYQKRNKDISGTLKLSFPNVGLAFYKIISDFNKEYPKINLEVMLSDEHIDLINDGFDAVIRFGKVSDSRLVAKKIGVTYMDIVHSPAYKVGEDERNNNMVLLYKYPSSGKIERWPEPYHAKLVDNNPDKSLVVNAIELVKNLCVNGDGLACLPNLITRDLLAKGEVVSLYSDRINARDVNVVWPYNKSIQPKLRAFIDFFSRNFQASNS